MATWNTIGTGDGTITSITAGYGLTGGVITNSGTISSDLLINSLREPCRALGLASTITATYSNGVSGVGATLTNNMTQVILFIDGLTMNLGDRVLVPDQSNAAYNGIYVVTNTGSVSTNWVLTRAEDFDGSLLNGISEGATVAITEGSSFKRSIWIQTASGPFTVGTTSISFLNNLNDELIGLSRLIANGIVCRTTAGVYASRTITGISNRISVTNGGGVSGDPTIDISINYAGQTSIITVGTITTGAWSASTIDVSHGGTGTTSLTNHGILLGHGTSAVTSSTLTNGQLLIGSTGNDPVASTITSGTGIFVSNSSGGITISATDVPNNIIDAASNNFSLMTNTVYITDNGSTIVTYTLPLTAVLGDYIEIVGKSSGGWKIAQNASQSIKFGNQTTTAGTSGFLSSTDQFDCIKIKCVTSGSSTVWVVTSSIGNITFN